MDVMLERLSPGMEHQGEADLTAEPPGITAKGLQGGGGALEEEAVEQLGVALGQGVERVRQGQDTMERLLLDSRVVGFADVIQPNCCHPFLLEALLCQ